jgi:membrane peptidoglycan carboxypeptidase
MAEAMGLRFDHPNSKPAEEIIDDNDGAFTLGPYATSPLDLVSAYSTLAANGTQCDPTPVIQILDRDGRPLEDENGEPVVKDDNCTPEAIPPGVATTLNQILIGDVASPEGTGTRAVIPGHDIAGKTGTSQRRFSAAFVGYTPQYAASVMVLDPKVGRDVGGFGGNKPATIWHDAMAPILTGQPAVPFPPADRTVAEGDTRAVPACSSVSACEAALEDAGFRSNVREVDSDQPEGEFVGTNPAAGTRANLEETVTIQVSNGSAVAETPAEQPAGAGETDDGERGPD